MKSRDTDSYFGVVGDSRTRAQIGTLEWISDYPSASGFYDVSSPAPSFLPRAGGTANDAQFCDPRIDHQIARARRAEQATDPDAARRLWERIDRQLVDQAPWVPLFNPKVGRRRLEAGRQLPVQPLVRDADRPALGALTPRCGPGRRPLGRGYASPLREIRVVVAVRGNAAAEKPHALTAGPRLMPAPGGIRIASPSPTSRTSPSSSIVPPPRVRR